MVQMQPTTRSMAATIVCCQDWRRMGAARSRQRKIRWHNKPERDFLSNESATRHPPGERHVIRHLVVGRGVIPERLQPDTELLHPRRHHDTGVLPVKTT